MSDQKIPKKFDKKVRWEFQFAMHGYGRTCREALLAALEQNVSDCERGEIEFDSIERHETVDVIPDDIEADDE